MLPTRHIVTNKHTGIFTYRFLRYLTICSLNLSAKDDKAIKPTSAAITFMPLVQNKNVDKNSEVSFVFVSPIIKMYDGFKFDPKLNRVKRFTINSIIGKP